MKRKMSPVAWDALLTFFFVTVSPLLFSQLVVSQQHSDDSNVPHWSEDPALPTQLHQLLSQTGRFWEIAAIEVDEKKPPTPIEVGFLDIVIFPAANVSSDRVSFIAFVEFDRHMLVTSPKNPCHPISYPVHAAHLTPSENGVIEGSHTFRGFQFTSDNLRQVTLAIPPRHLLSDRIVVYTGFIRFWNGQGDRRILVQYFLNCANDALGGIVAEGEGVYNVPYLDEFNPATAKLTRIPLHLKGIPENFKVHFSQPSLRDPANDARPCSTCTGREKQTTTVKSSRGKTGDEENDERIDL
jgi:hypothetical protein